MADPIKTWTKDPDSVLDYQIDWSDWLASGESIATSTWTLSATGITQDSKAKTQTTATIWLSGGSAASDYDATNRVTTSGGRTVDRTIRVRVRER